LAQQKRAVLSGPAGVEAWGPETVLGVMLAVMLHVMMLDMMLAVILAVVFFGGKGRACNGHQKQSGGKNFLHGINLARLERRR
jgi:hypothetical protein